MSRGSTMVLRGAVILIGLIVLALCGATVRAVLNGDAGGYTPILLGMYVAAIPFFLALYQTLKLLNYIEKNKAFSKLSVKALNYIKYYALIISGLYTAGLPYTFHAATEDDAPGVFALGLIIAGTSFVIATSAGVLQKLLQTAVDLKSENDLTV